MSKFKRVADLKTPEYLEKFADSDYEGDPYAELKDSHSSRLSKIEKNRMNFKASKRDNPHSWEVKPEPTPYKNFEFPRDDSDYSQVNYGLNDRVIRRSDYETDKPFTARNIDDNLKIFSAEQYTNALLKGASIWSPDMQEIAEAFSESQQSEDEASFSNSAMREAAREADRERWERKANNDIKKSRYSMSRANPILRTGADLTSDHSFGMIDWSSLDNSEQQRLRMRENRRQAQSRIKRAGSSREDIHRDWEENIDMNARTMQDFYTTNGIDLIVE